MKNIIASLKQKNHQDLVKELQQIFAKDTNALYEHYKDKISKEDFDSIIEADPTPNKNYSEWVIIRNLKGDLNLEDLESLTEYLSVFNYLKIRQILPIDKRDIMKLKDIGELYSIINVYKDKSLSEEQFEYVTHKDEVEYYFKGKEWMVVIPKTMEAAIYWGRGSEWCTANPPKIRYNHFKTYNDAGPLFILINLQDTKEYDNDIFQLQKQKFTLTKKEYQIKLINIELPSNYQLHFEKNDFEDILRKQINLVNLAKENPELEIFFRKYLDAKTENNTKTIEDVIYVIFPSNVKINLEEKKLYFDTDTVLDYFIDFDSRDAISREFIEQALSEEGIFDRYIGTYDISSFNITDYLGDINEKNLKKIRDLADKENPDWESEYENIKDYILHSDSEITNAIDNTIRNCHESADAMKAEHSIKESIEDSFNGYKEDENGKRFYIEDIPPSLLALDETNAKANIFTRIESLQINTEDVSFDDFFEKFRIHKPSYGFHGTIDDTNFNDELEYRLSEVEV